MPIPDWETIWLPLLQVAADGQEHSNGEAREVLTSRFGLTAEEQAQRLPSGQPVFYPNRVLWARFYLQRAGLLEATQRGRFRLTERGRELLRNPPPRIDLHFLEQYPEFMEFRKGRKSHKVEPTEGEPASQIDTPQEAVEKAYQSIRSNLAQELLSRVKDGSAAFFERLVVELLLKMGYGGSRQEAGEAIGRSGDEGIDGVIYEDRLGLDTIYIQAKKWGTAVGRPEVQKFVGALQGRRARKGVFITTSSFSSDACEYVSHIEPKVVLIDGERLAELMIDFGVGVTPVAVYEIKRVDSDYFSEE